MATKEFKFEDFDNGNDEMAGYEMVKLVDIIGKPFVIEKVTIQKDKNCDEKNPYSMNVAFDMDGDKLFFYTTSNRLVRTIKNIQEKVGTVPSVPVMVETEKYEGSPNPGYKFVTA